MGKTPYLVHWLIGGSEGPVRHLLHGIVEWQPLNKIHLIPASLAKNVKFLQLWSWKHKYWQFSELLIFIPSCSIMGQNQVKLFFTYFLTYIFGNVNSYWARKFELSQAGKRICETKQIKFTKLKKISKWKWKICKKNIVKLSHFILRIFLPRHFWPIVKINWLDIETYGNHIFHH